ncbi:glycosyltransferase [Methylorubrum populi]|uniref:glycosyltransferase n=1 Tax=Methylorubrum populi TaxID=223967 RepID=UPI00186AC331|nr:glycosyltransferase [Methylorubrum populi]
MRICIASPDIVGPIRNGGVGTACTALAQTLTAAGHAVDLFYTSIYYETGSLAEWRRHYAKLGIGFIGLEEDIKPPLHRTPTVYGEDVVALSYQVYQVLKSAVYDIIHFVDYIGLGYFTALAKHQGLCLKKTTLVVTAHAPTLWSRFANTGVVDDVTYLLRDRMERRLVEYADVLLSPSHYMLGWMQEQGWKLPARLVVKPNLLPSIGCDILARPIESAANAIEEIVFYGRLEPRKGLLLFCDAIDRIDAQLDPKIYITFLGKVGEAYPLEVLQARAARWRRKVAFLTDRDTFAAVDYLKGLGRLAVMAAVHDNSPYTLLECLFYRIPFIATTVGGIPELVAAADHQRVLVRPLPAALADGLLAALAADVFAPAAPSFAFETLPSQYLELHEEIGSHKGAILQHAPATPRSNPLVTVNILHYERPQKLMQAIESIEAQDYSAIEIVVVDNGSRSPEAVEAIDRLEAVNRRFPTLVVRMGDNFYEPAARNKGAYLSRGQYVLFMDDDNVAKPHEVSTFSRVAEQTAFDVLTCFSDYFSSKEPPEVEEEALKRFIVIGDCGPLGLLINGYGDLNCFVRRDRFLEAGGFVVDGRFNHAEDWRFFVKAETQGLRIGVIPEALLWYRAEPETYGGGWRKRDRGGALDRAALAYCRGGDEDKFVRLAQGLFWRAIEGENERRVIEGNLNRAESHATRMTELVEQLSATNMALRQDLLTVLDFVGHLTGAHSHSQSEVDRALKSLATFAARRS